MTAKPVSNSPRLHPTIGLACAIAAAALLSGCAGTASLRSAAATPGKAASGADRAVAHAEQAVSRAPKDAAARAALGQAYLAAGRFASAATALDDAMTLGDNSGPTALRLALAKIGLGRQREAVALLDDWRSEIPAADLGLALALAGETGRGVAVLSDAVRSGESTVKLRQNLAYAYALDGRWAEARLTAAQDVPAAELDQRIAGWALSTLPAHDHERMAALIGAPLRNDPGQPAMLALQTDAKEQQLAVQAPAPQPAPAVAVPASELPAVAAADPAPALEQNLAVHQQTVAYAPAPVHRAVPTHLKPSVAAAFVPVIRQELRPVSKPAAKRSVPTLASFVAPAARRVATGGTHLVQLGAFSSQQGARRAWGVFTHRTPGLTAYRMTITSATVNGKPVWRVAAAGLNGAGAAAGLCSQVRSSGGACFAYAAPASVPSPFAPGHDTAGPQRARR